MNMTQIELSIPILRDLEKLKEVVKPYDKLYEFTNLVNIIKSINDKIQTLNNYISKFENEFKDDENAIKTLQNKVKNITDMINYINNKINELENDKNDLYQNILEIKKHLSHLDDEINYLESIFNPQLISNAFSYIRDFCKDSYNCISNMKTHSNNLRKNIVNMNVTYDFSNIKDILTTLENIPLILSNVFNVLTLPDISQPSIKYKITKLLDGIYSSDYSKFEGSGEIRYIDPLSKVDKHCYDYATFIKTVFSEGRSHIEYAFDHITNPVSGISDDLKAGLRNLILTPFLIFSYIQMGGRFNGWMITPFIHSRPTKGIYLISYTDNTYTPSNDLYNYPHYVRFYVVDKNGYLSDYTTTTNTAISEIEKEIQGKINDLKNYINNRIASKLRQSVKINIDTNIKDKMKNFWKNGVTLNSAFYSNMTQFYENILNDLDCINKKLKYLEDKMNEILSEVG